LDFKQLEAYVNVYELKSFSKAAEKMFLSQPSISAYIGALEKELNTQLIYRSTKDFIPTKTGILFYQHTKDMLSLRDNSIQSIKAVSASDLGSIDILASSVPAQYILPKILGEFHKLYPDVLFNLQQQDSLEVVNALSSYQCEVGFVGAKIENANCVYETLLAEKLVMIAPYEDRFLNIKADNVPDLINNEYFVMREAGSGTRLWYEECLQKIGIDPAKLKISALLSNTHSIIDTVANGLGISIVSELAARNYIRQNKIVAIDLPSLPERNFYLVLNKNRVQTPIVNTFIDFVHSYSKGL
jgi:DNA-binding transcriptional LysR family regulator